MLLEWVAGEWYFAVRCKSCDLQFAFEHDPNHNRERFRLTNDQRCFSTFGRTVVPGIVIVMMKHEACRRFKLHQLFSCFGFTCVRAAFRFRRFRRFPLR